MRVASVGSRDVARVPEIEVPREEFLDAVGGGERMGHFGGPEWARLPRVEGGEDVANPAKLVKCSSQ